MVITYSYSHNISREKNFADFEVVDLPQKFFLENFRPKFSYFMHVVLMLGLFLP